MISTKYIDRYIEKMRKIQDEMLNAFDAEKDSESLENELVYNLSKFKILDNNDVFRSFLHLLSKLYENRHQFQDNLKIIESIILYYKKDILNIFQNCEIFTIFKNDNRLLLFLINSEILKIDNFVINAMKDEKYSTFFFPEIKDFLKPSQKITIEALMTDDFLEKRQIGENHSYICELIRNDAVDQFITHVSQTNLPLSYEIEDSIFETNSFLIGDKPNLIEYAAYFGSIQIFQYLQTNGVELTSSIWYYAIHSKNSEILQILEDNDVKPQKENAVELFNESIACHYNDIASYIYDNYINNQDDDNYNDNNNNDNNNNDNNNNDNNNNDNNNNDNNNNDNNNNDNNNNDNNNNDNNNNDNNNNDNNNNDNNNNDNNNNDNNNNDNNNNDNNNNDNNNNDNNNNDNNNNDNNNNDNNNNDNNNNDNNNNDNNNNDNNNNDNNNNDNNNNDNNNNDNNNDNNTIIQPAIYFQSYNFAYIETEFINYSNFIDLCEYDYTFFVDRLMKTITPDDLNKKVVKKYVEMEDDYEMDYETSYDATALFVAVKNDNNEVVKMLLSNDDINVNYTYKKYIKCIDKDGLLKELMFVLLIPIIILLVMKYVPIISSLSKKYYPAISSFVMKLEITMMAHFIIFYISTQGHPNNNTIFYSIKYILSLSSISYKSFEFLIDEWTVLNLACYNDNTEIANLLLSKKDIDVNAKYKYYDWTTLEGTALTFAVTNDNNEIVKNLLSNPNIDVNIACKYQVPRTAPVATVFFFLYSYIFIIVSILYSLFSSTIFDVLFIISLCILLYRNRNLIWPFVKSITIILSAYFISFFIIELISSRSFDHILIKTFNRIKTTKFNYNFFSDINNSCLIFMIIDMLSSLLWIEYKERSPLHIALEKKNIENAKLLLENKSIDVNSVYKSCIYNFKDKTIDINTCNSKPFDICEQEYTNKTALNMAAEINNTEIVELLLSFKNIDVNAKCKSTLHKRIPFIYLFSLSMYAVESIICRLLGRRSKKSTLDIAIENTNVETVKKLLENSQIKDVKDELRKLKKRQLENGSSTNKDNEQANNETENESNETKNRSNEILELLQKFNSES